MYGLVVRYIVILTTFYSPSCLCQESAKRPFIQRVKLLPAHMSTTHGGGFTPFLFFLAELEASNLFEIHLWEALLEKISKRKLIVVEQIFAYFLSWSQLA